MLEERKRELVIRCVGYLMRERREQGGWLPAAPPRGAGFEELWCAFRVLVNTRPATPAADSFLADQDELLQGLIAEAGITRAEDLPPVAGDARIRLWRGDITTLAADAIVNAVNAGMTGCWQPLHGCIDNAIHTFAGVQLRLACAKIMARRGRPEPTATATVTGAYNLPARRIIHTVGPVADGRPTQRNCRELARCYERCLDAAAAEGLRSIAFCCISTGVFGFPRAEAARIAVGTVRRWLAAHPADAPVVVFDVFLAEDERIYRNVLAETAEGGEMRCC